MKLEPGMLCRVVKSDDSSCIGKIIQLGRHILKGKEFFYPCSFCGNTNSGWMEAGESIENIKEVGVWCECCLQPIRPDREPADQEFQKDLQRVLKRVAVLDTEK